MFCKKRFLYLLLNAVLVMPGAVFADDDCQQFSPAFVLCTVHSHNAGFVEKEDTKKPENPTATDDVAYMNEVVAYKSTVIAQQLKRQYDALNAIVSRFKTQMKKAVMVSKLEVATGVAASGNSGSRSGGGFDSDAGLAGAQDCDAVSVAQAYDCIASNMQKIQSDVSKDLRGARAQMNKDCKLAQELELCGKVNNIVDNCGCDKDDYSYMAQGEIKKAASSIRNKIRKAKDTYDSDRAKNSRYRDYP